MHKPGGIAHARPVLAAAGGVGNISSWGVYQRGSESRELDVIPRAGQIGSALLVRLLLSLPYQRHVRNT